MFRFWVAWWFFCIEGKRCTCKGKVLRSSHANCCMTLLRLACLVWLSLLIIAFSLNSLRVENPTACKLSVVHGKMAYLCQLKAGAKWGRCLQTTETHCCCACLVLCFRMLWKPQPAMAAKHFLVSRPIAYFTLLSQDCPSTWRTGCVHCLAIGSHADTALLAAWSNSRPQILHEPVGPLTLSQCLSFRVAHNSFRLLRQSCWCISKRNSRAYLAPH